jgi:hypothetical protein
MYSTIRTSERRREARDPLSAPLSILCYDPDGRETVMHAKLVDISISGARMSVLKQIPVRSSVTFFYGKLGIGGRGTVRFCRSGKGGYNIGLQFANGTGWSPALKEKLGMLNLAAAIAAEEAAAEAATPAVAVATEA